MRSGEYLFIYVFIIIIIIDLINFLLYSAELDKGYKSAAVVLSLNDLLSQIPFSVGQNCKIKLNF